MPRHITEYVLYKWRYQIGYIAVAVLVASLLIVATLYVPGGLSQDEMASTVASGRLEPLSPSPTSVIDLPYSLLQQASFQLLGVSNISIKLPSLILGLASIIGIIALLRHWFHTNVAVISALIVITTSQFIFASQDGTPTIMYIFTSTWILLLALKSSLQSNKKRSFWELLLVAVVALSLYTPLSIYVVLALISATLLHPHLRYIIRRLSRRRLIAASVIGLAILAPLIMAVVDEPAIGLTLLGIPENWPSLLGNGKLLLDTYFGYSGLGDDSQAQPVYMLPSLLLAALGAIHLFRTKHTARSYIISSWLLLLTPIILINPSKTAITFVPVMLLIAAGIDELLHRWYRMFPRNPYARVAGLFPITLLVLGMALTGIERYFYAYRYNPPLANVYSDDLSLLHAETQGTEQPLTLLPNAAELPFYQTVAKYEDSITVLEPSQPTPEEGPFIATRTAFAERSLGKREPAKIITNGKSNRADRLYRYE